MDKCEGKAFKQSKKKYFSRLQLRKYSKQWEKHKVDEFLTLKRNNTPKN